MSDPLTEALVVVESDAIDSVLPALRQAATVTQVVRPHLALVSGGADPTALERIPGVRYVFVGAVPEGVRRRLEPPERLFVDAWEVRHRPKPERPGEGLPWDAPGFQPPDLPR